VKDEDASGSLCCQLSYCRASLWQSPWLGANDLDHFVSVVERLEMRDEFTSPSLYAQKYAIIPMM